MSYIEKVLGGKVRGLLFNQGAHVMFVNGIDKEEIGATTGYSLVYAGLKMNAFAENKPFVEEVEKEIDGKKVTINEPITKKKVMEWADGLNESDLLDIMNAYKETQAYKNLLPKEEDDNKKKLQVKNMKRNASK